MSFCGVWKPLAVSKLSASIPSLYVKFETLSGGYAIRLTDLCHLWREQLDHRQVIEKALNEESCINPSEDEKQLEILLQKLQEGLENKHGQNLARLYSRGEHGLLLTLCVPLPHPLPALAWSFRLDRCTPYEFSAEILMSALAARAETQSNVTLLLDRLSEKDGAIERLLDRLSSSGMPLSGLLPGHSRHTYDQESSVRVALSKSIKGLAPFDRDQWLEDNAKRASQDFDLLPTSSNLKSMNRKSGNSPHCTDWWTTIQPLDSDKSDGNPPRSEPSLDLRSRCGSVGLDRKRDPSVAAKSPANGGDNENPGNDGDTTETDDKPSNSSSPANRKSGSMQVVPSHTEHAVDKSSEKGATTTSVSEHRGPRKRIGMLGRKAKTPSKDVGATQPVTSSQTMPDVTTETSNIRPKHRLGMLKGKRKRGALSNADEQDEGETSASKRQTGEVSPSHTQSLEPHVTSQANLDIHKHESKTPRPAVLDEATQRRALLNEQLEEQNRYPRRQKRRF